MFYHSRVKLLCLTAFLAAVPRVRTGFAVLCDCLSCREAVVRRQGRLIRYTAGMKIPRPRSLAK